VLLGLLHNQVGSSEASQGAKRDWEQTSILQTRMQTDWQPAPIHGSAPRSRRRGFRSAPAGDPGRCWGRASRWPVAGTAVSGVATMLLPLAAVFCRLASFWEAAACGASC